MDITDYDLNKEIIDEQKRLEDSGLSNIKVKIKNKTTSTAIMRLYDIETQVIDFELFRRAVIDLHRLGMFKGIEVRSA